jgi:cytochrome c-type biogenesis protein
MDAGLLTIFAAGIGTFFTPCVLPLIPIYLAILFKSKTEGTGKLRQTLPAFGFILGFSIVFMLLGLGASSVGAVMAKYKTAFALAAGFLVLIFGLKFLGVIKISFLERDTRFAGSTEKTRFATVNAFLMGFFFAFGWTPCVGPILGSVLTWTAVKTHSPLEGAIYLGMFSAGFSVPMLLAAVFTAQAEKAFNVIKPRLPKIEKALGAIMVFVALTILIDAVRPLIGTPTPATEEPVAMLETDSPGVTLVEFYQPSCPACKSVAPVVANLQDKCSGTGVKIEQANVQEAEHFKRALKYGINAVPTFVFIDKAGNELGRLLGVHPEQTFRSYLTQYSGLECRS